MRLFALIRTADALVKDPELGERLHPDIVASAHEDPDHITPIEQEDLPQAGSVEELLGTVRFGPMVDGSAISLERIVLPPEAEEAVVGGHGDDEQALLDALMNHPQRQDVRMVVGVMRDGSTCAAVRSRANDNDASVGVGPDLAPGVTAALREMLDDGS